MENTNSQIQPYSSAESFALAQRMAVSLAKSTLVPTEFRGETGVSNCLIAIEMAGRIGMSPFMCMQNLYVIQGRPSWSSKFLIAMINASGRFESLQYRMNDEKTSCIAYAKDKRTGEVLESPEVTMEMAKKEGWYGKNGSKWQTMPELMLRYRAAAFFARVYCPELSLGLYTAEEASDMEEYPETKKVAPVTSRKEQARKITEDLLGTSEAAAPVIEAELKPEAEQPDKLMPEPKPGKPEQNKILKDKIKTLFNEYLRFMDNNTEAAHKEMTSFVGKAESSMWNDRDVARLYDHLDKLRAASAPDFDEPSQDDADAVFDMPPVMAAGDSIEI